MWLGRKRYRLKVVLYRGKLFENLLGKPMTLKCKHKRYTRETDCEGASWMKLAVASNYPY
jgi:hypothetical protein